MTRNVYSHCTYRAIAILLTKFSQFISLHVVLSEVPDELEEGATRNSVEVEVLGEDGSESCTRGQLRGEVFRCAKESV